jgi:hypothetical protein
MYRIKQTLVIVAALLAFAMPTQAKFLSVGPRIGIGVNEMKFSGSGISDLLDSDNRTGFTAGLEAELMIPVVNLGLDVSAMYVRRDASFLENNNISTTQRDYIDVPVNVKWKIGIPAIGSLLTPYIFTGPDFAFLTSKKAINEAWESKSVDVSWNIGAGVQLFSHLQIGASYGIGITKAAEKIGIGNTSNEISGKNNYWTVTAAWLF